MSEACVIRFFYEKNAIARQKQHKNPSA